MKNKTFYHAICCAALLLTANFASHGQIISASAVPDSVTVGDEISFRIILQTPKEARVITPETSGFGNFTLRNFQTETKTGANYDTVIYDYTLAIFKPQNCTIPSLSFIISGDSLSDTLSSEAVPVHFISVLPQDGDGEFTIRDLKAQQVTGRGGMWWIWLIAAAALGAAAFYIFTRFMKKKTGVAAVIPQKPPYEEAIEALRNLEEKKLLQRGLIKEHVFELSEIFKRYIGRRFDTNAPDLTSDEIVLWLESSNLSRELRLNAEWFFRTSDPVKFAKWVPDSQTLQKFDGEVRKFLEATKPLPDTAAEAETQEKTETPEKTERPHDL